MKATRRLALAGAAAGAAGLLLPGRALAQTGFDGDYGGVLDVGAAKLRLRLVVAGDTVTLYSLDQGNAAIRATQVERKGDWLHVDFAPISARFEGQLAGSTLTGRFIQGQAFPLKLERGVIPADTADIAALAQGTMSPALLRRIRERLGTPAMAVGWERPVAYPTLLVDGRRSASLPDAVRPDDRWHIGSITKSFTATLFARAVEGGAIRWDTPLGKRLKQVPPHYADLTAIELLSHNGGLPANIPLPELLALPRFETDPRISRRRYVALALAQPPAAAPRTQFLYSNVGYVLVGAMLEAATRRSWEDLLQREVLIPLGLSSAGHGPPGKVDLMDQPRGHGGGQPVWLDNPSAMGPAGRLHMAARDLLAWLSTHRDQPQGFLSSAAWRELHTPRFGGSYALGWFVGPDGSLWHNGSNTAWYAEAAIDAGTGLASVVCANDTALISRQRALLPAIRRAARVAR